MAYISNFFATFSSKKDDNIPVVVFRLIKFFGIKLLWSTTRNFILTDPYYPSLKSISNFFEHYGIPYYALNLTENDLYELERPFIAFIKEGAGKTLMVYKINKDRIIYTDTLKFKKVMPTEEFLSKWNGVAFVIDPSNLIEESDFKIKRNKGLIKKSIIPFAFIIFVVAILFFQFENSLFSSVISTVVFISHLAGLMFSILLFQKELNIRTKLTDTICHISDNFDCDAITRAKASKLYGDISWADIGIVYFVGGLFLLAVLQYPDSLGLLSLLALCAIAYPVFSVFYQWLILKKWCPLCLIIQLVLVIEFIELIPSVNLTSLSIPVLVTAFIVFSLFLVLTMLVKYQISSDNEAQLSRNKYVKLIRKPELFIQQIESTDRIDIPIDKLTVVFGKKQSNVIITVFLSCNCSACADAFDKLYRLYRENLDIRIQLVFAPPKDEVSAHFLQSVVAFIEANKENQSIELIKQWYKGNNRQKIAFCDKGCVFDYQARYVQMINDNRLLYKGIAKVPTVFVNGMALPSIYSIEDIRYYIPILAKYDTNEKKRSDCVKSL